MVARKHSADRRAGQVLGRLFAAWQRALGQLFGAVRRTAGVVRGAAFSPSEQDPRHGSGVLAVGIACLLGGAAMGIAFASPGPPTIAEISAGVQTLVWAVIRLALMRLVVSPSIGTSRLRGAWAAGLTPWILGVSPWMRMLAWLISGLLTWRLLKRDVEGDEPARAVGLAWGAHAVFGLGVWLLRNVATILMAGS